MSDVTAAKTFSFAKSMDVTEDRISRMDPEDILSAQIQPNTAKMVGCDFTLQMENDPKHTTEATQQSKQWHNLQKPSPTQAKGPQTKPQMEGNKLKMIIYVLICFLHSHMSPIREGSGYKEG